MGAAETGELLETLAGATRLALDAVACSIARVIEDSAEIEYVAADGAGADEIRGTRLPVGQGIAGWVVASGQPVSISDPASDPRFARDVAERTGYIPRAIASFPLTGPGGTVIGVLTALDSARADEVGMDGIAALARPAGIALAQAATATATAAMLLSAVAETAPDQSLADALRQRAAGAPGPSRELARVTALLARLTGARAAERALAVDVLEDVLRYIERAQW